MKSNVNLTSTPLRAWADYLAWVSSASEFREVAGSHQCTVPLPDGHLLKVEAPSADLLAKKVMAELASNLVVPPHISCSAEPLSSSPVQVVSQKDVSSKEVSMRSHYEPALPRASETTRTGPVTSTKDVLQTFGVYVPESMHEALKSVARNQGKKFSVLIRELVERGYDRFEEAFEQRSGRKVLDGYEQKVAAYSGENSQWMARLDRTLSLEIKLTAKEYGRSASQIVGGFLAEELSYCLQTQAVTPCTAAEVEQAQAAMAGFVGPKASELAIALGLPGKRKLVNELVCGIVRAPSVLLDRAAEFFKVSQQAIAQAVSLNFRQLQAPSFKAPNGQPKILTEPVSWEEAVRALNLPYDEEAELLALGD